MLRNLKSLGRYQVIASDGPVGSVEDFYFDDERWAVRYLVVDTGRWLPGRLVLISPIAIDHPDWSERALRLSVTREQVKNSPPVDTHQPVSRLYEAAYATYFGYPYYWGGAALWGPAPYPALIRPAQAAALEARARMDTQSRVLLGDEHLRSANEVTGYHLHAADGQLGHVDDFVAEDVTWAIRYVIVDTSDWWFGKHVLIPPSWIREADWTTRRMHVDVARASVKRAPEFRSVDQLNRQWEAEYFAAHGRTGYWSDEEEPMV
jgi:hypothetical protein